MTRIRSFDPVHDRRARVLILGSMPGEESLRQQQYYAHPRNCFWDIMGALFDAGRDCPYGERLRRLKRARVALWDVVGECRRPGSLDSDIDPATIRANDIGRLLRNAPEIHTIFFNGGTARRLFARLVEPGREGIRLVQLPSTSPANARWSPAAKRRAWRVIRDPLRRKNSSDIH